MDMYLNSRFPRWLPLHEMFAFERPSRSVAYEPPAPRGRGSPRATSISNFSRRLRFRLLGTCLKPEKASPVNLATFRGGEEKWALFRRFFLLLARFGNRWGWILNGDILHVIMFCCGSTAARFWACSFVGNEQKCSLNKWSCFVVEFVWLGNLEASGDGCAMGLRKAPFHVFSCHVITVGLFCVHCLWYNTHFSDDFRKIFGQLRFSFKWEEIRRKIPKIGKINWAE